MPTDIDIADLIATADTLTRSDVIAGRDGFITARGHGGYIIGLVVADTNAAGQPTYRAHAGDVGTFAFKRADAVQAVVDLHNMQEKARAFDLIAKFEARR